MSSTLIHTIDFKKEFEDQHYVQILSVTSVAGIHTALLNIWKTNEYASIEQVGDGVWFSGVDYTHPDRSLETPLFGRVSAGTGLFFLYVHYSNGIFYKKIKYCNFNSTDLKF